MIVDFIVKSVQTSITISIDKFLKFRLRKHVRCLPRALQIVRILGHHDGLFLILRSQRKARFLIKNRHRAIRKKPLRATLQIHFCCRDHLHKVKNFIKEINRQTLSLRAILRESFDIKDRIF
ncbi:hypothetical protein D3C72_1604420 [compost metagenome]